MNEIQKKINSIQTILDGLYEGGDVTEAARSSLQYTLNEAQKVVKNITYEPVLAPVLPKWDCDDCKYYPCTHHEIVVKENKLRYNQCGDHSDRGTP